MARQHSETSANLRMAFTTERFFSRKSCVGDYAADKGIPILTASLCLAALKGDFWFLWLGGPPHREGERRGRWWRAVKSGIGPWGGR